MALRPSLLLDRPGGRRDRVEAMSSSASSSRRQLRPLGDHLAVLTDVKRRPVHLCRSPGCLARSQQRSLDTGGELWISVQACAAAGACRFSGRIPPCAREWLAFLQSLGLRHSDLSFGHSEYPETALLRRLIALSDESLPGSHARSPSAPAAARWRPSVSPAQ